MTATDIFLLACAFVAVAGLLWCVVDRDLWKRQAIDAETRAEKADQGLIALSSAIEAVTAERYEYSKACDQLQEHLRAERTRAGTAENNVIAAERDLERLSNQLQQQIERHRGETRATKAVLEAARQAGAETLAKLQTANGKILDLEARLASVVAEGDRLHALANSLQSRVAELEAELDRQTADVAHVAAERDKERIDLNATIERWRNDCEKYQQLYWQVRDAMLAERQGANGEAKAVQR